MRGLREALAEVELPGAGERFSVLCGEGVLVVGASRERALSRDERVRLRRALATLVCPPHATHVKSFRV